MVVFGHESRAGSCIGREVLAVECTSTTDQLTLARAAGAKNRSVVFSDPTPQYSNRERLLVVVDRLHIFNRRRRRIEFDDAATPPTRRGRR